MTPDPAYEPTPATPDDPEDVPQDALDTIPDSAPDEADADAEPVAAHDIPGAVLVDDLAEDAFRATPLWLVADVTTQVIDLFTHGRIDRADAEQALEALVVTEADGTRWAYGATTRRWFRKPASGSWQLAAPPAHPESLQGPADEAVSAGMWSLGVDPAQIDLQATAADAARAQADVDDLLDDLLEGYGDPSEL